MKIIRENKEIILTEEEIRSIMKEEHRKDIHYEYENAVELAEDEKDISFDSWQDCPFGSYSSLEDAREDFIDKLTEDYLEQEELYERDPNGFRQHDFYDDVIEFAKDCEYLKEEN